MVFDSCIFFSITFFSQLFPVFSLAEIFGGS